MTATGQRTRLRRSDCSSPGLRRVRHGRGFTYLDERGEPVGAAETLRRVRELAIPPAWREVWICPDPRGHLQATGVDAAGRKQYLYHVAWRTKRDGEKFRRMLRFAEALPRLRRRAASDLQSAGPNRERVLACGVRLLDLGLFRIGGEEYAEEGGGLGLATIARRHVTITRNEVLFDYPAKSGVRRRHAIDDAACAALLRTLKRRGGAGASLLAYREGRSWVAVRSADINGYLKRHLGEEFSAKDFRTWNATVLAAVALATDGGDARSGAARRRAIDGAVRHVAAALGNTPAVARSAYIDPRVFDRYRSGWTIAGGLPVSTDPIGARTRLRLERAVLDLLTDERDSSTLERPAAGAPG